MAKGNLKDAYYFSHDSNARNDEKIMAMRSVYGLPGYAMYFMLVEILREQSNYKIKDGKYTCNTLAMQMQCTNEEIKNFINDCCEEFELLQKKDGFIYSESLLRRMEIVDSTSEKRRKASEKRWSNANEVQMQSKCNANEMQLESKRKEKKVNETKEKEIKIQHIVPPKHEWVCSFCEERKNGITADEFINFYESKGWLIGKTKMKDWQAAIRTWEKNRNVKIEENNAIENNVLYDKYAEQDLKTKGPLDLGPKAWNGEYQ